jgi:hypothetical protein
MNIIDEIFVISFYNNEDRINNICKMQEKFSKKFTIVEPVKDNIPQRSLTKTNLKIWLENFNKNILIFEDDFFTHYNKDDIEIKLDYFYKQVNEFDILLLGGDVYKGEFRSSDLIKATRFSESHAILYNKNILPKLFSKVAANLLNDNTHIDQMLSDCISEENLTCYLLAPSIFTQQNFPSLINGINLINSKYDVDHLLKKEFDNNSIKIVMCEFDDDFYIEYCLINKEDNNLNVNIFVVDINSGIRVLDHELNLLYGFNYYNASGRLLVVKDEVFFEIYNNNKLLIRKIIKKSKQKKSNRSK